MQFLLFKQLLGDICTPILLFLGCISPANSRICGSNCGKTARDFSQTIVLDSRLSGLFILSSNASDKRLVPEWFWRNSATSCTLQSVGLETSGPENFQKGFPQTRHFRGACSDQPWGLFASCRGARRRVHNCSGTASKLKCNNWGFCSVVLWR